MAPPDFKSIKLRHSVLGDAVVLGAVDQPDRKTSLIFLATGTSADDVGTEGSTKIGGTRSVGDGLILTARSGDESFSFRIGEASGMVTPMTPDTAPFEGRNCALAVRNGESPETVRDWLLFHVRHHGLEAVVILDRAKPAKSRRFRKALQDLCADIEGLKTVYVVAFDHPLGKADQPPEAHPFSVPGAPGKDRMEVPEAAPWDAPLGEMHLFEMLRHLYLEKARAVMSLEVYDLLEPPRNGTSVFDRAVASTTGAVLLQGRQCYPWRTRKGEAVQFGDHICVPFDATRGPRRWCVAPDKVDGNAVWRLTRIVGTSPSDGEVVPFWRAMALRHPTESVARIVPKTSLVEDPTLIELCEREMGFNPVRMPELDVPSPDPNSNTTAIITCMKNEGPFILEWLAYHRVIGVNGFLVYTNDCTDGTDTFLDLLQDKGFLQHRDNPFKNTGLKPQHAALQAGENEPVIRDSNWVISMDVDEFINIKVGDGTLSALWDATGDANMISCTWRLFGNGEVHGFVDTPLIAQLDRSAREMTRKPHQAWGFKTLFRNIGLFKKLGVHRPKGLNPQLWNEIRWVNGSGARLPKDMYRNAWRSTTDTVGYDLVQLNHYAVRSAESFLVKRDRGRVNHVDRDQGLAYWFRMNNNAVEETSIQRMLPQLQAEMDRLMADPEIAAAHEHCVTMHRAKIGELRATENYAKFYTDLTGPRMENLARRHHMFGANVFLAGPDVIPDDVALGDHPDDFFFTVDRTETTH